jgi:hypothetical protein
MVTIAVGIVIAVLLLFGFGFISTASVGWFFKFRKPHETLSSADKN